MKARRNAHKYFHTGIFLFRLTRCTQVTNGCTHTHITIITRPKHKHLKFIKVIISTDISNSTHARHACMPETDVLAYIHTYTYAHVFSKFIQKQRLILYSEPLFIYQFNCSQ